MADMDKIMGIACSDTGQGEGIFCSHCLPDGQGGVIAVIYLYSIKIMIINFVSQTQMLPVWMRSDSHGTECMYFFKQFFQGDGGFNALGLSKNKDIPLHIILVKGSYFLTPENDHFFFSGIPL